MTLARARRLVILFGARGRWPRSPPASWWSAGRTPAGATGATRPGSTPCARSPRRSPAMPTPGRSPRAPAALGGDHAGLPRARCRAAALPIRAAAPPTASSARAGDRCDGLRRFRGRRAPSAGAAGWPPFDAGDRLRQRETGARLERDESGSGHGSGPDARPATLPTSGLPLERRARLNEPHCTTVGIGRVLSGRRAGPPAAATRTEGSGRTRGGREAAAPGGGRPLPGLTPGRAAARADARAGRRFFRAMSISVRTGRRRLSRD